MGTAKHGRGRQDRARRFGGSPATARPRISGVRVLTARLAMASASERDRSRSPCHDADPEGDLLDAGPTAAAGTSNPFDDRLGTPGEPRRVLARADEPPASAAGIASAAATAAMLVESPLMKHIKALREEKNRLRDERAKIARDLKNAERKKMRLRHKARQLSETDLIAVLQMRALAKASASATPSPASAASSSSSGSGNPSADAGGCGAAEVSV